MGTQSEVSSGSKLLHTAIVLRSLNPITKKSAMGPGHLGRSSPDPGLGANIELSRGNLGGLFDLIGSGKALPSQRITPEEPPPTFLEIEPAGSCRNEDVMQARMLCQPGAGLRTVMAAEIIGDDKDAACRILRFNVGQ